MKQSLKIMAAGICSVMLAVAVAGCSGDGGKNAAGEGGGEANKESKPTEITISTIGYENTPSNDLEGFQEVNKKLNVKLNVSYIPSNTINEKTNAILASQELPDVMFVEYLESNANMINAIRQGAFWDLTPYIKDYPNLSKYPQTVWENAKMDGKNWGIPRVRPLDGHEALSIRQDWLDKLGLEAPKTLDELYNVMEKFTKDDPDGNGKADTYGLVFTGAPTGLMGMFGSGNNWAIDPNGDLIPNWWTPEFKEGLSFFSKAFKAGLIVPDFPVLKGSQLDEMLLQSKAGIGFTNVNSAYNYNLKIQKDNPQAKFTAFELPKASDGQSHYSQSPGYYGQMLISKEVSEDKLKKILEVYNYTATEEGYNLIAYGIKDTDYTVEPDGSITQNEDSKKKYDGSSGWLSGYFNKYQRADVSGMPAEIKQYNHNLIDSISAQAEPDPSIGISPPAVFQERGSDWFKKRSDMMVNVVLGKSTLENWDQFVKSFMEDPNFKKYVQEINDGYKKKMNP